MKTVRFSLFSALCALSLAPAAAQEVIQLPEDGGLWHTTLILSGDPATDAASARLVEHFANSPRLQKLAKQTNWHRYTPSDPLYQSRYSPYFGGKLPALLVQKPDGFVVYKVSGEAIPQSAERLADEIAAAIDQCCPVRPKPQPTPTPSPEPEVEPEVPAVHVEVVPDIRPTAKGAVPKAPGAPVSPLVLLMPLVAGALGLRRDARRVF